MPSCPATWVIIYRWNLTLRSSCTKATWVPLLDGPLLHPITYKVLSFSRRSTTTGLPTTRARRTQRLFPTQKSRVISNIFAPSVSGLRYSTHCTNEIMKPHSIAFDWCGSRTATLGGVLPSCAPMPCGRSQREIDCPFFFSALY